MSGYTWRQCLGVAALLLALAGCGEGGTADCHPLAYQGEARSRCQAEKFWGAIPERSALAMLGPKAVASREALALRNNAFGYTDPERTMDRIQPALDVVDEVTADTLPTVHGSTAIWEALPGMATGTLWRFTATTVGSNTWDYTLQGKAKTAPDSAFVLVLSGHTERAEGAVSGTYGSGTLEIDWDAASTLPEHGTLDGTLSLSFSMTEEAHAVEVEMRNVTEGIIFNGVDGNYRSVQTAEGPGEITYSKTSHRSPPQSDYWTTVRIRWDGTGAGRADTMSGGGTRPVPQTDSTCWDATLQQTLWESSASPSNASAPTACAFTSASYYLP